jgi:hypothetical protein
MHKAARKNQSIEAPRLSYTTNRELHGDWSGFVVDSVSDYDRLYAACMAQDVDAIGYFSYLNSAYQPAGVKRTPGIARIIKGYRSVNAMSEMAAYKARLKAYKARQTQSVEASAGGSGSRPALDDAAPLTLDYGSVPMLTEGHVVGAQEDIDNYQSMSPPLAALPLRDPINSNPRDPPQAVGQDWARVPIDQWPRGMRVSDDRGPRRPTPEERLNRELRLTPHLPDVQVLRYLTELSPFRRRHDHATRLARQNWLAQFITLFSLPGLYRHIVESSGFATGNRRRERFPFTTSNLGLVETAIWLLDHGLHPNDPQVADNETWAQYMRSLAETRPSGGDWERAPHNTADAQRLLAGQLANVRTEFQYPPRAPSAHPRSWATSSEMAVDLTRRNQGLPLLLNQVNAEDEVDEEMTDLASGNHETNDEQAGSQSGVAQG